MEQETHSTSSGQAKTCQNCKNQFAIEPDDFAFYEKIKVPPPTWCPECRAMRRFMWRNERTLWKTTSDATGKQIFSMFPPGEFEVYEHNYWFSDKWDAIEFGKNYDFSKTFFAQLKELMHDVPWFNASLINAVNSEYTNHTIDIKNCYLSFDIGYDEDCAYITGTHHTKNSLDLDSCTYLERSAHNFYCHNSYGIFYSSGCEYCNDVWFSRDCIGCSFCFGCVGLRNKSYYIFNKAYSKEDYFKELEKFNLGSAAELMGLKQKVKSFWSTFPVKSMQGSRNTDVSGDYIYNCKNVKNSFWVQGAEDCKYLQSDSYPTTNNSYDLCIAGVGTELCYDSHGIGVGASEVKFTWMSYPNCSRISYCMNCHDVSDCFGCIGLRNKQYCIFNKQYTKKEYEELLPQIIQHMNSMPYVDSKGRSWRYGEFFPTDLSPFGYNETVALEYFPLTREKVIEQGFSWRDSEERSYNVTMKATDIPEHIDGVSESILKETIQCAHEGGCKERCTTAFRLVPQELELYKERRIALPRLCSNCRHAERLLERNPLQFWHRSCQCGGIKSENSIYSNQTEHFHGSHHCPNNFETTFAPDRAEIVYCEQCYQAEVS